MAIDLGRPARVVFLDRGTLKADTILKPLPFAHELVCFDRTAPEDVEERIADADIVISNKVVIAPEAMAAAANLKLIAVAATGTNNVDLAACQAQGVAVSNIRNYAVHTVPEHSFALIFALRRSIAAYHQSVAAGRWQAAQQFCYFDYPIRDLAGSTLGIIGGGTLGKAVARIAEALGMGVLFAGRKGATETDATHVPFDHVLAESDIITLHLPLTPTSHHLIGAPEFARMARRPLLINTARGGIVDEIALGEALRSGQIAGAGFDVATSEPPPPDHPLMSLLDLPNFILTPHIAWASDQAVQSLADQLIEVIAAFWAGHPRNLVTG